MAWRTFLQTAEAEDLAGAEGQELMRLIQPLRRVVPRGVEGAEVGAEKAPGEDLLQPRQFCQRLQTMRRPVIPTRQFPQWIGRTRSLMALVVRLPIQWLLQDLEPQPPWQQVGPGVSQRSTHMPAGFSSGIP